MKRWLIVGVVLLAFVLRVFGISTTPSGFTPDEASFGYDAYSILRTGKDQWGESWPLAFRSFGDFKLPLYTYITIPTVAFFGLNEFAVRFPNALFGTLAVLATYLFVNEYFKKKKNIALLSAIFLAISPWHVQLSRGAFEANLTTFFLPMSLWFFLKGLKNTKYLALSSVFFILNTFTYHSARILTPLIILFLIFSYRKKLKVDIFSSLSAALLFVFGIITFALLIGGSGTRAVSAGIFNPTDRWGSVADARYYSVLSGEPDFFARIFHNKVTYTVANFSRNYISYFSPQFLFTQGPSESTYGMVPGQGLMYIFEIAFLIAFVWALHTKKINKSSLLLFWMIISPVAPALAKGSGFAANRAAFGMPVMQIVSALGCIVLFNFIGEMKKRYIKNLFYAGFAIFAFLAGAFFIQSYLVDQKAIYSNGMIYGTKDLFSELKKIENNYDQIIISKKLSEPQIYVAFFNKMDPLEVQRESVAWRLYEIEKKAWVDQLGNYHLGKYTFTSINNEIFKNKNILLVGTPEEFSQNMTPSLIIKYPNGKAAHWVIDTNKL